MYDGITGQSYCLTADDTRVTCLKLCKTRSQSYMFDVFNFKLSSFSKLSVHVRGE